MAKFVDDGDQALILASLLGKDVGKGRIYHGTAQNFKSGDLVKPSRKIGASGTTNYDFAKKFAQGRGGFVPTGLKNAADLKPRVFQVTPNSPSGEVFNRSGRYLDVTKPENVVNDLRGFTVKKQVSPLQAKLPSILGKVGALGYIPMLMQGGQISTGKTGGKPIAPAQ